MTVRKLPTARMALDHEAYTELNVSTENRIKTVIMGPGDGYAEPGEDESATTLDEFTRIMPYMLTGKP